MKNAIVTCCDKKYEDFLLNHWVESLLANVNLKNIDVIVIDYGLSKSIVDELKKNGIIVKKYKRDGFPGVLRFRDMHSYFQKHKYNQIMMCDGGDIIFQKDISEIFNVEKDKYRAVLEKISVPYEFMTINDFSRTDFKKIDEQIKGKRLVNIGVIVAPYVLFLKLCMEVSSMIKKPAFGSDTLAVNYVIYRDGFHPISDTYNFILTTSHKHFYVKKGEFYFSNGKKIGIVHNVGGIEILRIISNFGYGKDKNKVNSLKLRIIMAFQKTVRFLR